MGKVTHRHTVNDIMQLECCCTREQQVQLSITLASGVATHQVDGIADWAGVCTNKSHGVQCQ